MKKIFLVLFLFVISAALYYLLTPPPTFPPPPPGSLTSTEPADTETICRRAFYSQLSRSEIMAYYANYFPNSFRINHPPEESYTLIRDQTRSSWLEEIYYPWKMAFYINGFYPTLPTEQINIQGVHYTNKITLHYLPSHPLTRVTVLLMSSVVSYFLIKEYAKI